MSFIGERRSSAASRNMLEDQLTGHRKNSYGVEGMCVTNNPNARKIIKVSDEMRQRVFNSVKEAFYKYNGMSGDNEAEWEEMARAKNNYYKTLKKEDRVTAARASPDGGAAPCPAHVPGDEARHRLKACLCQGKRDYLHGYGIRDTGADAEESSDHILKAQAL